MARKQRLLRRLIGSKNFVDGSNLTFDIDRNHDLSSLLVVVSATVTVTDDYTAEKADSPSQLVNTLSLVANGIKTLDRMAGPVAYQQALYHTGQSPTLTKSGTTVAAHVCGFSFWLDRCIPDGRRPKDTNFPTRGLTSFQLLMTMGNGDDLFTVAADGVATISGTVKIYAIQTQEYQGADGKFTLPRGVTIRSQMDIPFVTTNNNFLQRIASKQVLRSIMFRTHALDVVSDSILNNVKVMLANETIIDMSAVAIRAMNVSGEAGTWPTGVYIIDFADNGSALKKITDALDLTGNVDLDVYLDVTGGTNNIVQLLTTEYEAFVPSQYGLK